MGKPYVEDRRNSGGTPREYPMTFHRPDRVVVTDGLSRGQSIGFMRDDGSRVSWIRVAVRAP